jgi:hypothetical protein
MMLGLFRRTLHHRLHEVKGGMRRKYFREGSERIHQDLESSDATDSDLMHRPPRDERDNEGELGVILEMELFVDSSSNLSYFCVCIGNHGESFDRKKCRGLEVSRVFDTRSVRLGGNDSLYLLNLSGLSSPEISVRFLRPAIVGKDTFLGECHFLVDATSNDSSRKHGAYRLIGGSNCFVACNYRICNPALHDRSNILPGETRVSDSDKRMALVASVWKCLESTPDNDPEIGSKRLWLRSLLEVLEFAELNYLLVRTPMSALLRILPLSESDPPSISLGERMNVEARGRFIKAIQMNGHSIHAEAAIASLLLSCPSSEMADLKRFLNRGGDKNTLYSLIFSFIQSDLLREQLLLYLQNQDSAGELHVVSEIDQLIHYSLHQSLLWPRGPVPGARALFRAISHNVTFVSTKPRSLEPWMRSVLREIGFEDSPLIPGPGSRRYRPRGCDENIQSRRDCSKYSSLRNYRRLYPNGRFVWIGSSLDVARDLLIDEVNHGESRDLGIATVVLALVLLPDEKKTVELYAADPGLIVCANFVQAAIACVNEGLLHERHALKTLVDDFGAEFTAIEAIVKSHGTRDRYLRDRLDELNRDLERLRECIDTLELRTQIIHDDMVDSIILTPIEAHSPSLTDRSAIMIQEDVRASMKPSDSVLDI